MKLVAFDVETRGVEEGFGLQPFRARNGSAWLTMFSMANESGLSNTYFLGTDWASSRIKSEALIRPFLRSCAQRGITICGWNTPFDMAWLIALGMRDEVYACNWLDGMMLWRHLTASPEWSGLAPKSYGLKAAVAEFYPDEAGYEQDIQFETDDPAELTKLAEYARKDADFTLRLCELFWAKLTEQQQRLALTEAACLPMVAEAHVEGITANIEKAEALKETLIETANLNLVKLKLNTREEISPDVLASPVKLRKLLFEDWKLPIVKFTDKGANSTDRDALSQLAAIDPRADMLNKYREAKNNAKKFAEGSARSLEYNGDGQVRPVPRVYGTYTGRMTYSSKIGKGKTERPTGVALHQWKRDKAFRDVIEVPEGYTLLEFDFSGQEFRWMAVQSGDYTMLELCQPGEDAHGYMGARIGQWDYNEIRRVLANELANNYAEAKDLRQMGKVANLSLQYRTSAATLIRVARTGYQLTLTEAEAKAIHGTYRTTYPKVSLYWKEQIRKAREQGYVETVAGRRVHLGTGDTWRKPGAMRNGAFIPEADNTWGCESTAINFPIQGSGADQKYLALQVAKDYLPTVDGRFYFELHDGVFFIVPDRYAEKAVAEMKPMLSNLPYRQAWGVNLPIQFPVDAKMGPTWGQLKEVK